MAWLTREPIHIIALTLATSPTQISALPMRAPVGPKMRPPATSATSGFPASRSIGVV